MRSVISNTQTLDNKTVYEYVIKAKDSLNFNFILRQIKEDLPDVFSIHTNIEELLITIKSYSPINFEWYTV